MNKKMLENIYFESKRLSIKDLSEKDIMPLFQIYSDVEAMKFRGSKAMISLEDAHDMIQNQFLVSNQIIKKRLGIRNKSNDELIGTLLLTWNKTFSYQCEVGFSFGKNFWNKGYGQETLEMIVKQFTIQKNIEVLKAWCIKENLASIKIFEKAGFSESQQNEYPNSVLFMKRIPI